jgi:hypothetical protein
LCVAPSGADVSASTHRCLDCRDKIHCAMWCGENWKEYLESERCNITPDQLSAAGRARPSPRTKTPDDVYGGSGWQRTVSLPPLDTQLLV